MNANEDYFVMTPMREDILWEDAVIVFDTSSLCSFYDMTDGTKKTMMEILTYLQTRIWLPAQVMYEYRKNREKVIMNPIQEKYQNPSFLNTNYISEAKEFIKKLKNMPYYHPYMEKRVVSKLDFLVASISNQMDEVKKTFKEERMKRIREIESLKDSDIIFDKISGLSIGNPFITADVMTIMKEGEFRYRNKFPPGYMDEAEKVGSQKYGDLIIWKEILKNAKEMGKPVIFVCDDVKTDWYTEHFKKELPIVPRHELIKEFHDEVGQDIWFYTLNQFVDKLESIYKDTSKLSFYEGLEAVKEVLAYASLEKSHREKRASSDMLWVKCENCADEFEFDPNDFDWYWKSEGSSERSMGPETEYICLETVECPSCETDIQLIFHVWEYPGGVFNYQNIDTENCSLLNDLDLSDYITFEEKEQCERCGASDVLDKTGLCSTCADEFQRQVNSDD